MLYLRDNRGHLASKLQDDNAWVMVFNNCQSSLLPYDCSDKHLHNIIKFTGDTAVVGLISQSNESAHGLRMEIPVSWCGESHINIMSGKQKEWWKKHYHHGQTLKQ